MAGRLGEASRHEPGFIFEQVDELNDRDFRASRDLPLQQVRRDFASTASAVWALIDGLTDDDINDAARVPWLSFEARHAIARNTYGHYAEDFAALEELVRRQS